VHNKVQIKLMLSLCWPDSQISVFSRTLEVDEVVNEREIIGSGNSIKCRSKRSGAMISSLIPVTL